jgi:regulatory protein
MELKIEKVSKHEKKKNKYVILLEDGSSHELNSETLLKFGLRSGDVIDEKRLSDIFLQGNLLEAKNSSLRLLAKRMRSEQELVDRLKLKKYDDTIVDLTIQELKRMNLINDTDFVERYINDCISLNKPYGKFALSHKLLKLGLNKDLISEKLSTMICEEDETTLALALARKKMSTLSKYDNQKKKQRIAAFLAGRGFKWETIRKIFNDLKLGSEE